MKNFADLGVLPPLVAALSHMSITTPTPVQSGAIPPAIEGRDILASAQTGSGKTIAYLMPILMCLMEDPDYQALILLPTRELATQVHEILRVFLRKMRHVNLVMLIGGKPMRQQYFQLKRRPNVVIATPGRINDHMKRQNIFLGEMNCLVLDEMDRMLDMGFSEDVEKIYQALPETCQVLMFSATLPPHIERLTHRYLNEPARVAIGTTSQAAAEIKQEMIRTQKTEKFARLLEALSEREGSVIVFVNMKRDADDLAFRLRREKHEADAMHGDLRQGQRERVLEAFKRNRTRILVATDVAARGLDVRGIELVINYDLPMRPEDYIHRIGRTGRAGATGCALSLVAPHDSHRWRMIHRMMNPTEKETVNTNHSGAGKRRFSERPTHFKKREHWQNTEKRPYKAKQGRVRARREAVE